MQLEKIQERLKKQNVEFSYLEEDGCGSIDFIHRGLSYHIWEYSDGGNPVGVETNLRQAGYMEEIEGDYISALLEALDVVFS